MTVLKQLTSVALTGVAALAVVGAGASSPDRHAIVTIRGGLIAFGNRTASRDEEIYLMNPDGTGERRLTRSPGPDSGPVWSPDGRRILFTCSAYPVSDICVVNANGRGRRRLTEDDAENRDPDWQPLPG